MSLDRLVVGTDASPEAMAAAQWAAAVAHRHDAELDLVEAFMPSEAELPPSRRATLEDEARERVRTWLSELQLDLPFRVFVELGDAEHVLRRHVQRRGADALIIGSKATEGTTSLALGSLAHGLAHHVPCPVVSVPCGDWHLDGGCVVVGVDGSEGSDIALRWAADLSEPLHAEVYGVFTVDEIYETFTTPPLDLIERKARFTAAVEEARRGVQFVERTAGDIVSGLADESAARHAALLVVGARARGSLGGLLLGTVPDKLIHEPPCPVAVLPFDFLESQLERAR